MKDRIQLIMRKEAMNQRDFAASIGISPSSLSSLLNGHTSVTINTASAIHRRFPEISLGWLMFGEGDMTTRDGTPQASSQDAPTPTDAPTTAAASASQADSLPSASTSAAATPSTTFQSTEVAPQGSMVIREIVKYIDKPQRRITEILVHYDDGTFETFPARKDA